MTVNEGPSSTPKEPTFKYDVVHAGTKATGLHPIDPFTSAMTRFQIDQAREQRREIIRKYEMPAPNEKLRRAVIEARKALAKRLSDCGIPTEEVNIPEIVFVPVEAMKQLDKDITLVSGGDYDGGDYDDTLGFGNVLNAVNIILYRENHLTDLEWGRVIFHELYHSVGRNIFNSNGRIISHGRHGFKGLVLEEGMADYEATSFRDMLAQMPEFAEDVQIKNALERKYTLARDIKQGKIYFEDGDASMDVRFALTNIDDKGSFSVMGGGNSGYAATIINTLLAPYSEQQRRDVLTLLNRARVYPKEIPLLAAALEEQWGKGIYIRVRDCSYDAKSMSDFARELKKRKNLLDPEPITPKEIIEENTRVKWDFPLETWAGFTPENLVDVVKQIGGLYGFTAEEAKRVSVVFGDHVKITFPDKPPQLSHCVLMVTPDISGNIPSYTLVLNRDIHTIPGLPPRRSVEERVQEKLPNTNGKEIEVVIGNPQEQVLWLLAEQLGIAKFGDRAEARQQALSAVATMLSSIYPARSDYYEKLHEEAVKSQKPVVSSVDRNIIYDMYIDMEPAPNSEGKPSFKEKAPEELI